MERVFVITTAFILALNTVSFCGSNPEAKVAVHVLPHASRSCAKNFPAVSGCEDIVYTYSGGGDIDFFVVFYNLTAYQGFQYAVTWPAEWSSCAFTSCSDLTIGGIETPGDCVAHAYEVCSYDSLSIPAFGWIDAGEVPGYIEIIEIPPNYEIQVGDCDGSLDSLVLNCRAGVNGYTGDDPCVGRGGDAGEGGGESGGIRGYYSP